LPDPEANPPFAAFDWEKPIADSPPPGKSWPVPKAVALPPI